MVSQIVSHSLTNERSPYALIPWSRLSRLLDQLQKAVEDGENTYGMPPLETTVDIFRGEENRFQTENSSFSSSSSHFNLTGRVQQEIRDILAEFTDASLFRSPCVSILALLSDPFLQRLLLMTLEHYTYQVQVFATLQVVEQWVFDHSCQGDQPMLLLLQADAITPEETVRLLSFFPGKRSMILWLGDPPLSLKIPSNQVLAHPFTPTDLLHRLHSLEVSTTSME